VRSNRMNWTKKRLVKMGHDPLLTEREIMLHEGYHRVYDCGNYRFKWNR